MMDNPNARELLKECQKLIFAMAEWNKDVDAIIGHTPKTGFEDAFGVLAKLDAYLAAPSESAMEIALAVIKLVIDAFNRGSPKTVGDVKKEAAALIESYGRRVPWEAWDELWASAHTEGDIQPSNRDGEIARIAAKYGVAIEEEPVQI